MQITDLIFGCIYARIMLRCNNLEQYANITQKWASALDYDTYHIGNQRRLRRACVTVQSRQSFPCSHISSMEVDEGSDQKSDI